MAVIFGKRFEGYDLGGINFEALNNWVAAQAV